MSRKSVTYKRGYEHTDFADLLNELQGNHKEVAEEGSAAGSDAGTLVLTRSVPEESEYRHRIMSDQKIRYLYSRRERVIHDKHCECAKAIRDGDLEWAEEYRADLKPCPECGVQAYIAAGAKDPKEIDRYCQFFEKAGMTEKQIRSMYIDQGMKTRIYPDAMTIWYKEDTWRIKTLPKKGHVQLYHNNYMVRKKGVREFTQGFHIQSLSCEDTNIGYALSIIKNYEYKSEEYALHIRGANPVRKGRGKMQQSALSLEELLGERTEPPTMWRKIREFFRNLFKKKSFFEMDGFQLVSAQGYPKDQTICIYIWKDKNGQMAWQTGIYDQKRQQFSVTFGVVVYAVKQSKVVAWKKMTADAVALDQDLYKRI